MVAFSTLMTLALLRLFDWWVPSLKMEAVYWLVGVILPILVSTPVTMYLVRQLDRNERLSEELRIAYREMKRMSETDHLTGVLNRGAFTTSIDGVLPAAPGWVLLIDVDHFKSVNDRFGHEVGDRVLRSVALALRDNVRLNDFVGRLGGEEFGIYLPKIDRDGAAAMAERLRRAVEDLCISDDNGAAIPVTVSVGFASADRTSRVQEGLRRADFAMYRAKSLGRNRAIEFA